MNAAFACAMALLAAMAAGAAFAVHAFQTASGRVAHTQDLIAALSSTWATMQDVRNHSRDYILTADAHFRAPLDQELSRVGPELHQLRELAAGNPALEPRVNRLSDLVMQRVESVQQIILLAESSGLSPSVKDAIRAQPPGDPVRTQTAQLQGELRAGLQREMESERRNAGWTVIALGAGLTLDFALLCAIALSSRRERAAQQAAIRQQQEARRHSESIVESVREPLLVLTADLHVVHGNRAFHRLFHATPIAIEGRPLVELDRGAWNISALLTQLRSVATRELVIEDFPISARFGVGERFLLVNARKLDRSPGQADLILLGIQDVTNQRALDEMHVEFRALFESLPGLYVVLTPDFNIVAASDAYLHATMVSREKLLGRSIFEAFPDNPDDPQASGTTNLRASLERVRDSGKTDTMAVQKYDVRGADGNFEERFWSPINTPVLGAQRQLEYIIHRVEDVTDFVRAGPRDGGAAPDRLAAEVFRSGLEVQAINQQLRAANDELESFCYSVSHDLRAPVRHIDGFAELLIKSDFNAISERGRSHLGHIADSAKQMGTLIDDLLVFSRMGRNAMAFTLVDLQALANEVIKSFTTEAQGRVVNWLTGSLPTVRADGPMLRQVFANLLGNAVKYTRPRDKAEIAVGRAQDTNTEIVIYIRDNGVGFEMEYADKLFGVFQRLHRAEEFEGTGIGLANVRRIIQRHGGRTWAEGKPQVGATFFFSLPKATCLPV